MSNQQQESDVNARLAQIEAKLEQLTQLLTLPEQVSQLEEKLMLVTDIDRYGKLQLLLRERNFKAADLETTKIMLETAQQERDTLTPDDISRFPCNALSVIDRLWAKYSNQHFGFSLQLKIYQSVGGNINTIRTQDIQVMKAFVEQVGWFADDKIRFPEYDHWDFSLSAPKGCFPAHWWKSPYGLKMVTFFFARLIACEI